MHDQANPAGCSSCVWQATWSVPLVPQRQSWSRSSDRQIRRLAHQMLWQGESRGKLARLLHKTGWFPREVWLSSKVRELQLERHVGIQAYSLSLQQCRWFLPEQVWRNSRRHLQSRWLRVLQRTHRSREGLAAQRPSSCYIGESCKTAACPEEGEVAHYSPRGIRHATCPRASCAHRREGCDLPDVRARQVQRLHSRSIVIHGRSKV